jgi:excisionase family DNA binding protein
VKEAAGRLGVSPKTVYRLIEAGKLVKCVLRLPSGRIRFDFEALLE